MEDASVELWGVFFYQSLSAKTSQLLANKYLDTDYNLLVILYAGRDGTKLLGMLLQPQIFVLY